MTKFNANGNDVTSVEEPATVAVPIPVTVKSNGPGQRGEVGEASVRLQVWQKWKSAVNCGLSLKKFAKQLAKSGDPAAKEWFANKRGAKNTSRSEKALQRIAAESLATKAARRKTPGKK